MADFHPLAPADADRLAELDARRMAGEAISQAEKAEHAQLAARNIEAMVSEHAAKVAASKERPE